MLWNYVFQKDIDESELSYYGSLIFLKDTELSNNILAVSSETGELVYSIPLDHSRNSIYFNDQIIYVNDGGMLKSFNLSTGEMIKAYEYLLSVNSLLFFHNNHIIFQLKSGEFVSYDLVNFELLWKTSSFDLVFLPLVKRYFNITY